MTRKQAKRVPPYQLVKELQRIIHNPNLKVLTRHLKAYQKGITIKDLRPTSALRPISIADSLSLEQIQKQRKHQPFLSFTYQYGEEDDLAIRGFLNLPLLLSLPRSNRQALRQGSRTPARTESRNSLELSVESRQKA